MKIISNKANGLKDLVAQVVDGKAQLIKIQKGQRLEIAATLEDESVQDEAVVATRRGADLEVRYADGTKVTVEDFYNECADGVCDVVVSSQGTSQHVITVSAAGDEAGVVYAYGPSQEVQAIVGDAAIFNDVVAGGEMVAGDVLVYPAVSTVFPTWATVALSALGIGSLAKIASGSSSGGSGSGSGSLSPTLPAVEVPELKIALAKDTGVSGVDNITSNNSMLVSNLSSGNAWEYSADNGVTWTNGNGSTLELPEGHYVVGQLQVRQKDMAGNVSVVGKNAVAITVDFTSDTMQR